MIDNNHTILFKPELTPKEMLEAGVFGGYYFKNDISEYPKAWFKKAKISIDGFDVSLNCFNVKSGLTMEHWISKGWIFPEDPEIDKVQIMRWKAFGPRHKGAILKNCSHRDYSCRPRQRQGLLQWGYNPFF